MLNCYRKYRLLQRLTKEKLAKKARIATSSYELIEDGQRKATDKQISRIANILDVSVQELQGLDAPWEPMSPRLGYFGEIVIHFESGTHLIASVTFDTRDQLIDHLYYEYRDATEETFMMFETLDNRVIAFNPLKVTDIYFSDDNSDTYGPEEYDNPRRCSTNDDFWFAVEQIEMQREEEIDVHPSVKQKLDSIFNTQGMDEATKADYKEDQDFYISRSCDIELKFSNGKSRLLKYLEHEAVWQIIHELTTEFTSGKILIDDEVDDKLIYINQKQLEYASVPKHAYTSGLVEHLAESF